MFNPDLTDADRNRLIASHRELTAMHKRVSGITGRIHRTGRQAGTVLDAQTAISDAMSAVSAALFVKTSAIIPNGTDITIHGERGYVRFHQCPEQGAGIANCAADASQHQYLVHFYATGSRQVWLSDTNKV